LAAHLAHFDANHLFWDLSVFAVLGAWLESGSRRLLGAVWILSSAAISAAVWFGLPELDSYRGLSGVDSALAAAVAVWLLKNAQGSERWLPLGLLLALGGKIAWEFHTGGTLFVRAESYSAVPLAHLVGACVGVLVASCFSLPCSPAALAPASPSALSPGTCAGSS